jgi:hypothetical protein
MEQSEQDLVVSVRSANMMKAVGATTVRELILFSEDEILSARCFGETTLREIKEKLAARGLRLGMPLSEVQGRSGTQGRIVAQVQPARSQQAAEPEDEGPCCSDCAKAARKLRERVEAERQSSRRRPTSSRKSRKVSGKSAE